MEKYRGAFPADVYTLENYMWAHAIMDSRSIWWGGGRHLTPMLDMINCMEGPGKYASRVHSTKLDAAGTSPVHFILMVYEGVVFFIQLYPTKAVCVGACNTCIHMHTTHAYTALYSSSS